MCGLYRISKICFVLFFFFLLFFSYYCNSQQNATSAHRLVSHQYVAIRIELRSLRRRLSFHPFFHTAKPNRLNIVCTSQFANGIKNAFLHNALGVSYFYVFATNQQFNLNSTYNFHKSIISLIFYFN